MNNRIHGDWDVTDLLIDCDTDAQKQNARLRAALVQAAEEMERASARLSTMHTLLSRELADAAKRAYEAARVTP
jgi:hypothetical protein